MSESILELTPLSNLEVLFSETLSPQFLKRYCDMENESSVSRICQDLHSP